MEPTNLTTKINYYHTPPPGEPDMPHTVMAARTRRKKYDPHPTKIHNLRLVENKFNLDVNGFQYVKDCPSCERKWDDDDRIKERVYPEFEMLLRKRHVE
ncbi:hypothetical protein CLAFUW4_13966 [Fulvia fulva]|uniref:Uncharacterized protein n=1 Tax=Passalora fulva TaxID=5499 RepID=A0A9Q8UW29_PASFU|nr:uncharacterized protein CLAFUR5_13806 [Fulvia fulva]KAK4610191.1 hypothetical protein CLAFUR4_13969 [Fulvia fulva]KAK4611444.1 hypothetical protein CLAFUR0_13973 [Fulvia fulva]UJO24477.1 hypothetical protein CLAFUR5_13806 [Fulvia fulva]WPV21892.1 hypothetical protein CLAFUW4_13966 [Fulvia fulva]WPV37098.1 hypothetical protein CLAFUW7_13974 [Fulvia fulva]